MDRYLFRGLRTDGGTANLLFAKHADFLKPVTDAFIWKDDKKHKIDIVLEASNENTN